jgi:hypothetical protein
VLQQGNALAHRVSVSLMALDDRKRHRLGSVDGAIGARGAQREPSRGSFSEVAKMAPGATQELEIVDIYGDTSARATVDGDHLV